MIVLAGVLCLCCSAGEAPVATNESAGRAPETITGKTARATGGFPSVVLLVPEGESPEPTVAAPAVMDQYGNAFHPKLLVVRPGQAVEFRNSEDVLHNVHVVNAETRETLFNVGTPVVGSYRHTFDTEGVYDVSCEIHPAMAAFVVVTDAPYTVIADPDGSFGISGLPAGTYRVTVWNLDPGGRLERTIEVREGEDFWELEAGES